MLGLDHVLWVPSGHPPHRPSGAESSSAQRLKMVRSAVQGHDRFMVWDGELRRVGPSYTVDTLRELHERVPGANEWWLLLGADQFRAFPTWREPERVGQLARLAVLARAGDAPVPDGSFRQVTVKVPRIDVSSTEIRRRVGGGETIRFLVPEGVRKLVEQEGLYLGVPGGSSVDRRE